MLQYTVSPLNAIGILQSFSDINGFVQKCSVSVINAHIGVQEIPQPCTKPLTNECPDSFSLFHVPNGFAY